MTDFKRLKNIIPQNLVILATLSIIICAFLVESNNQLIASIVTLVLSIILGLQPVPVAICFIMMLIPSSRSVEAFGISGAVLISFFCTLFNIINHKKIDRKLIVFSLIYILYSQQYLIRFGDINISIIMPVKIIVFILLFSFLIEDCIITKDIDSFLYSANTALFIGIISSVIPSIIIGTGIRLYVINNDSNMLAIECVFAFSMYSHLYFVRNILSKTFFVFSSITLFILTIMCGSRMGIVLLIFVLISSITMNIRNLKKYLLTFLSLFILLFIFINSDFGQQLIQNIIIRNKALISNQNFNNGRLDIWSDYLTVLNSNKWLWIFGLGDYRRFDLFFMAHNFIIEDIAAYGLIGLIILYFIYFYSFKNIAKHLNIRFSRISLFSLVPLLVPIIGGMTLHGLGSLPNYSMLFLGFLAIISTELSKNKN
ncbi:O-antigen ligase family protein [Anaerococcus nagyae]|uniref:O-antigen ligase family protein n=1 Tax=Anaerococcus nagyae TaxID=1755241 RepID=UPI001AE24346|nr:O-antigen ligase family protein [Anaerococcus nagyae]MBP2068992.1 hypothetical protein [Anaerococcus nagyae]